MSEIILAFGLITMFTMITNGMVIYKQDNLMTLDKMGIEIGKRCPEQVLEYLNGKKFNLSEISGKIIFVEEDCVTCQVLVETINVSGRKDDDMITILVGKKENAVRFVQKYPAWNKVSFFEREELYSMLNISAFPFYMDLNNGIVEEKGAASAGKVLKDQLWMKK